jgi:hypothetical protein
MYFYIPLAWTLCTLITRTKTEGIEEDMEKNKGWI